MRRKFMAWIMSIMMIATMMPTMAFAEGESAKDSPYQVTDHGGGGLDGGLYMSKTLDKIDKDGKGTITLETYVKGKIETSSTPMDIVLVLDVSGSMDDPIGGGDSTKKIDALKSSVNSFIDKVYNDASKIDGDTHNVSIVKFSGNERTSTGNDFYTSNGYRYNYSQVVQGLTDVKTGAQSLKKSVNSLEPAGSTRSDNGMKRAKSVIDGISASRNSNKVVIMFTDGKPTTYSDFNDDVANGAITASKGMKDKGVSVYTIGMFSGADNSDVTYRTSDVNKYMHFVSSNYPNAQRMDNSGERAAGSSFYKTAKTASELEAIFEEISSETKDTELDESTIIKDVMSEYFETDGSAKNIKIYEAEYKGNDQFGEKTQITGDALSKYTVTADSGQVSVKGFDFEAVMDTPKVKGKKLIIEIPVKLKDSTISNESLSGKTILSNNTDSAISSIIKTTEPAQSWNFEIPKVKLPVAKTDISGTKTWVDDSNADNTRPDSITLKLYRNIKGEEKTEVTGVTPTWTKNGNTWTYEYKDLPKTDADGNVYTYTVKEELAATSPYEAKYDGNNITNSLKSGTTDFSGEKVWKDSDGKPIDNSKLPASIEIELLQNGKSMTPVQKQTVTPGADNKWTYTFKDLPKYDKDGKRYQYSIKELSVNGYQSSVTTAGEMTNQYNGGESVTVEGTKTWTKVPDGAEVPEVTIKLLQNGKEYKTTKVTKNANGEYVYKFDNLPKYDQAGKEYTYTVEEVTPAGYTSKQEGNDFENEYTGGEKKDVKGTKTWAKVPDGAEVPEVTIKLLQNGKEYKTTKVKENADGTYSYEFKDLPTYDPSGKEYKYTVEEVTPAGYTSKQEGNNFENEYTGGEKKDVKGTKTWTKVPDGAEVPEVTIKLLQNGKEHKTTKVKKNADGTYSYEFKDLPTYDPSGKEYKYTVEEVTPAGYTSKQEGNDFENEYTGGEKKDVKGTKTWTKVPDGAEVPEVTIKLLQNGKEHKTTTVKKNADGTYSYEFKDLPTYDPSGKEYKYTVEEVTPAGYTSKQEGNNFENEYTGGEKKDISGTKTWTGVSEGAEVPEVTIKLLQNGKEYKTTKVKKNADGTYSYEFKDLPTYDESGNKYTYTVEEVTPDGYESTKKGNDFENKYTGGEKKDISGTKTWTGVSEGAEVPEVTIKLLQNGKEYKTTKVKKNADGTYSYEFKDLPTYDESGNKYTYTVEEVTPDGYESTKKGNDFENKYTGGEKKDVKGTKTWAKVPEGAEVPEVMIKLLQNGKEHKTTKVKKNADGTYSYEFKDLPTYDESGNKYTYTVEEVTPDGYESTKKGNDFENKYTGGEKKDVKGTKTWAKVPEGAEVPEVTIKLLQNGKEYKTTKVKKNADGTYSYEFKDLPTYDSSGKEYKYTVEEVTPAGYTSKQDGNDFENTYTGGKEISISGTKTWLGMPSGLDKKDYPDVTIILSQNGTESDRITLTEGKEDYEFNGLPEYNTDGKKFEYTVSEVVPEGYVSEQNGNDFTNTYTPGTVSINGVKKWVNTGDSNKFPEVTVDLYQNGTKIASTVIKDGATSYSFDGLDKLDPKGKPYVYTVKENVPNGYTVKQGEGDKKYELTNTYTGGDTTYPVEKKWAGVDNNDSLPAKVKVTLYRDGEKTDETAELTKDNNWKHTFTGLLKYRTDGTEYKYSVKEEKIDGYTTTIDEGTVTNTYTGDETKYPVEKKWTGVDKNDPLPASVRVTLYKDGEATDQTVELTKDNNWKHTFTGLTKYRTDGTEYDYSVKEEKVDGYTTEYGNNTVINNYTGGDTEYSVEKKWAGVDKNDPLPAKVKVTLYQDGKATDQTVELTKDNNWKHVFKGLKKYRTDGSEYVYSVREEKIDGYTTEYGDNTVINSYTGGDKVNVKGTKTWIDPEGTTHPTITIELYREADGIDKTFVKSIELADGTTDYEFTDLEKYATNGSEYNYTVKEKTVDGYTTSYDKEKPNNITNTIKQEKIDVKGTKTWIDADGTERPEVSVQLYRDGEKFGDPVKIGSDNKYEFKDLDKYDLTDGHVYRYTVRELGADGYITTIDRYDITNSRPIKTVKGANDKSEIKVGQELTYTISWTNASKEAVTATIKDTLTKGQEYVSGDEGAVVETKDGITTVKWENVAVAAGSKVEKTFTVKVTKDAEKTVDNTAVIKVGDKPEIDSNTTSVTPKIDISGEKIWKDKDDNFKLRPDSVKITLLANGEKTDKTTEATEASGWKYSFSDLPLYNDGKKIEYTVEETPVDNYLEPEYEVVNKDANQINIINSINEELFSWTGDITVDKAVAVKVDNEYAPQKVTDTFYFALFSDKELTKRATMKSEDGTETEIGIEKLELKNEASGTVTFKGVPTGTIKEPVKYYLAETDKDGVPVGEGFRYTPEFGQSGSEVSLTVKDHDADLKVANVFDNKIDVSGKKTWVDDNDKHKQRPDDITVFLKQNGEDYRDAQENTYAVHASKDTDWAYTFKDLPEFDAEGNLYEYSVDEAFVEYYDAVFDGMDITNTFDKKKYYEENPATITVTKETLLKGKEYKVNDIYYAGVFVDKDHTTLLADEEGAYIIPLVLENESSASFEFKVPYHEDGTATYYITEVTKDGTPVDKVSGLKYKASVKGGKVTVSAEDSVASVTFTNSYEQPKVPKTGDSGLPLIWMLIGLMAAALAAAAWIIFGRRETRRL